MGHDWEDNIRIELRKSVDCTHLSEDRDQWQAPVNRIMIL
jgi:hypothetical protein